MLHRPLKDWHIHQYFGENKACVPIAGGAVITCDGSKPPAGYKSLYGAKGHLGLDLRAPHGTEVYCAAKGLVVSIDTNPKSGLDVRVVSEIDGRVFKHIYEHLLGYQPQVGDIVETGQLIGWADNTGYSSGDHLHFQVEEKKFGKFVPIDPLSVLSEDFAKTILLQTNLIKYLQELIAQLLDNSASKLRERSIRNN